MNLAKSDEDKKSPDAMSWYRAVGYLGFFLISSAEGLLAGHYVEDVEVGGAHRFAAYGGEIADRAVYVVVDDAFGGADAFAVHGEHGRHHGDALTSSLRNPKTSAYNVMLKHKGLLLGSFLD